MVFVTFVRHYYYSNVVLWYSDKTVEVVAIKRHLFMHAVSSMKLLRSADTSTLLVPPTRRTTLGDRSFPAAAARAWNTLPQQIQDAPSLPVFRRELKTAVPVVFSG